MKKVYVIGEPTPTEAMKIINELAKSDQEAVFISSPEDIPIVERGIALTKEIFTITAPHMYENTYIHERKGKKGHQRPYKYHP
jgi:hypothetical protein